MADRSISDVQRELWARIQTEGVLAAFEAALAVARDPTAPAPARATASGTLFRVAGYFEKRDEQHKEPHQMTAEELDAAVREAQRRLAAGGIPGVFD